MNSDHMIPQVALLVHAPDNKSRGPLVVTVHTVIHNKNGTLLDPGRILGNDEAAALGARLCGTDDVKEPATKLLPERLLQHGHQTLTWYRPPARTYLHWRTPGGRVSAHAITPGLIFHVNARSLYVAAYVDPARPRASTVLYNAPLGNVYASGAVCVGNASLPVRCDPSTIDTWERVLLGTNFTHANNANTLAGGASNEQLVDFWTRRQRYKNPPAARLLTPMNSRLGQWLNSLPDSKEA